MVSICIPTYNGARFLSECLDTALAQTWSDFEIIVVDDRSTDSTVEVAATYAARHPRVKLYQNDQNLGLAGNWTQCVRLARGQWIKFLFQDDLLGPTCLAQMLATRRHDVPLIVTRRALAFESDTPNDTRRWYERHAAEHMLRSLFPRRSFVEPTDFAVRVAEQPRVNCIGEPTATLIERSVFDRFGTFNPHFKVLTDWEFLARIAAHHGLCYVDDELATFRVHSGSTSQTEHSRSSFRVLNLDALIMLHELAYSAVFEPVRKAAMRRRYPIDFRFDIAHEVRSARRKAKRISGQLGRQTVGELGDLIRVYPRLAETPRGYLAAAVSTALRHVRWNLTRRAEGIFLKGRRAIRPLGGRHT